MNKTDPNLIYQNRKNQYSGEIKDIKKKETLLSLFKLAFVVGGLFSLYKITLSSSSLFFGLLAGFVVLFGTAAVIHEHYIEKKIFVETLKSINESEMRFLNHEFLDVNRGEEFMDTDHNFSSDLDIFGEKSLFHAVNRTTSWWGNNCLADWLGSVSEKKSVAMIRNRQAAVKELAGKIDVRQKIQAYGKLAGTAAVNPDVFSGLLREPERVLNRRYLLILIHSLPVLTLASGIMLFFGFQWYIPLGLLGIQILLNRLNGKHNARIFTLTSRNSRLLKAYSHSIAELEQESFSCELLKTLRENLFHNHKAASAYIARLSTIFSFFSLRRSEVLHPLANSLLFWDLHCVCRIEKWKRRVEGQVDIWFEGLGIFEAISSFAGIHFNFPDWSLPQIRESGLIISAKSLGHPLIPKQDRICNDLDIDTKGKILIVTGPNMAGKSTFLKTTGVNLVLALAGAPVCAGECSVSPVNLYTSMKVSDSLDKNLSLFYAELQRLKLLLEGIEKGQDVFFLMDEMLKGTNALDRQAGAMALLNQLAATNSTGIVATHDLEITRLEHDYPSKITNYHFDGYVEGDKLRFDYKLKRGKCESFNALILMRKIGINI